MTKIWYDDYKNRSNSCMKKKIYGALNSSKNIFFKVVKLINKNEADLTEKPNISILEITEKRSRSAENNRPRNLTKV